MLNKKAYHRSLITANNIINDRIKEGTNVDTIKRADQLEDLGIDVSTLIPLLLVDGDPEDRKMTHLHLVQDSALHRQRTALKLILSSNPESKDFHLLFKLAIVYFMLAKYEPAAGYISTAVKFCPKNYPFVQRVALWKGLIYFYYLFQIRKGGPQPMSNKSKVDLYKQVFGIIKSCEEALKSVN